MRKVFIILVLIVFFQPYDANGQQLDYEEGRPILDSDLDGLTDLGETELFLTDPNLPDTDGDGMLDGAEVISGSNPNDILTPIAKETIKEEIIDLERDSKWGWYVIRSSGIIAFLMLYFSFLTGLFMRISFIKKKIDYLMFDRFHFWLSFNAVLLVIVHGVMTVMDKFIDVSIIGFLVPFMSNWEPVLIGIGTIAFYVFLGSIITSYFRKNINIIFKIFHGLTIIMYFVLLYHSLILGTDFQIPWLRNVVFGANIVLIFFCLMYFFSVLLKKKTVDKDFKNKNTQDNLD